ncbi:hypothetical protein D3C84_501020 [compost metagenome]
MSSRPRSLMKAAEPSTGPSLSATRMPDSEYQPKLEASARAWLNGMSSNWAASRLPSQLLRMTVAAIFMPQGLSRIWRSRMPELRIWMPMSSSNSIRAHSLHLSMGRARKSTSSPSSTPPSTTKQSWRDSHKRCSLLGILPSLASWVGGLRLSSHQSASRLQAVMAASITPATLKITARLLPRFST